MDEKQKRLEKLYLLLNESNLDLKKQIMLKYEELKQLEKELKELKDILNLNELEIKNEIRAINDELNIKDRVECYKLDVLKLYESEQFNNRCREIGDNWTNLEGIFLYDRFCIFFYNDTDSGSYPNIKSYPKQEEDLKRLNISIIPHVPKVGEVTFNNYDAFQIACSNKSDKEKFDALNLMFDKFLNPN